MKKNILLIIPVLIFLFIFNLFNGNPVSEKLAQTGVEKYIEENHPGYEIKRLYYDGLNWNYYADVWIPDSQDYIFNVRINHFGTVEFSDYKYTVANNFNTHQRANIMYSDMCEPVIDIFTQSSKMTQEEKLRGSYGGGTILEIDEERMLQPPFENDKQYTVEEINALGAEYGDIYVFLKNIPKEQITAENLADKILRIKNEFDRREVNFSTLTVFIQGEECNIYWMDIPYEMINEQDILQLTKENSTFEYY